MYKAIKALVKSLPPIERLINTRDELIKQILSQDDQIRSLNEIVNSQNEQMVSIAEQISSYRQLLTKAESLLPNYYDGSFPLTLVCNDEEINDTSFIRMDEDGKVTALVPVDLLFCETIENSSMKIENMTSEWIEQNRVYADRPIIHLPHVRLYEFFSKGGELPTGYINWWRRLFTTRKMESPMSDVDLLEKRYNEFKFMQKHLNTSFFIEQPCLANWNYNTLRGGYFNLRDGHHRASFLYSCGFPYIPVKMKKEDYLAWRNDDVVLQVAPQLKAHNRYDYYTPILNPFFMNIEVWREQTVKSRLHHILQYLDTQNFHGKTIIDIGSNIGFFSNHFSREGAEVVGVEPQLLHYDLAIALQKLMRTHEQFILSEFQGSPDGRIFEIGLLLTVYYHIHKYPDKRDIFLNAVDRTVTSLLFWESGDEYDNEREYILHHTGFNHFQHIAYTFATGKLRELGVFSKDCKQ